MMAGDQLSGFREWPICIALATALATVGVCTAIFFATWRMLFDCLGSNPSAYGTALMYVMAFAVIPVGIIVLSACIDRCRPVWLGFLTFFVASVATPAFICWSVLRRCLPASWLAEGTNSSLQWYCGALVQLLVALWLLSYFRAPQLRLR